ncbi:MAG: hypothetical protein RSG55_07435 [Oscillospiraceae bacterium]
MLYQSEQLVHLQHRSQLRRTLLHQLLHVEKQLAVLQQQGAVVAKNESAEQQHHAKPGVFHLPQAANRLEAVGVE